MKKMEEIDEEENNKRKEKKKTKTKIVQNYVRH
jgi:hypothetical protein